jgi:hypothetical protein
MATAFVHQILNHYTSPTALDPGFRVLDNSSNERPDWYEYWPIRKYLLNERLDEGAFYGFLSPKFKAKTNLRSADLFAFLDAVDARTDVVLFSPSIENSAHYWNVFQHGDAKHPGLLAAARQLFERLGRPTDLDELMTDSRIEVFSNYFVARPRFWREWLRINEAMFAIAEDPDDPLGAVLRARTAYRAKATVPMKIFVMERIATWLLAVDRGFAARAFDSLAVRAKLHRAPVAVVCDALKIAYATDGRRQYRDVFDLLHGLRDGLNRQIRLGNALGLRGLRAGLGRLAAYWGAREGREG